jgi:hypothetical protein
MTSACLTFDEIESQTVSAMALAFRARQIKDGLLSATISIPLLLLLANRSNKLHELLRSGVLDKMSDDQLKNLACRLLDFNRALKRVSDHAEVTGIGRHHLVKPALQRIRENLDNFDSTIENIYLALDPAFREAIDLAVDKLNLGVEERAAVLR